MAEHPRPDVSDMYAVHGVFRDTLGAAPRLVGGISPDDEERVALIANYYDNVLSFLEAHHGGEEALVFPLLRERCADQLALVEQMAEQHEKALRLLAEARASLAAWPAGDAASPLAEANLSPEEWGALPGHGLGHFEGDKIWLIIGLIRQRMNDEQRAAMLENMPPPAVEMWTGFGEQAFKDYSQVVVVEVTPLPI